MRHWPKRVGKIITLLAWRLARREKRIALHQIRQHLGLDEREATRLARAMTEHLALSLIESLQFADNPNLVLSHLSYSPGSREILEASHREGKGVLFLTGHLGNWELQAAKLAQDWPLIAFLGRRSYDPKLEDFVSGIRSRWGMRVIDRDSPSRREAMGELLQHGGMLGVLIDQDSRYRGSFVDFFGRPALVPTGAIRFALKAGALVLAGGIHREGQSHFITLKRLEWSPESNLETEVVRLAGEATRFLEEAIRCHPEQWVWFHERWRSRPGPSSLSGAGGQTAGAP